MLFSRQRPEVGRAEKQARNLGRIFFWCGMILLCISMGMAGKFGFGLGRELPDKVGNALFYVLADGVGAALMMVVGLLFARRWYGVGVLATIALAACIVFSVTSIFGFQAANRVAISEGKKLNAERVEDRLKWLRGMMVDKGLSKERQSFLSEEREQFTAMQGMDALPDAQASELAKLLGIDTDQAQRGMNIAGSGFILFLQFVCLSLSSFLRQRVEPEIAAQSAVNTITPRRLVAQHNSDNSHNSHSIPDRYVGFPKDHALSDLRLLVKNGLDLGDHGLITNMAARWKWDRQRVRRFISGQPEFRDKLPPPRKRSRAVHSGDNFNGLVATPNGKVHAS